MSGQPAAGRSSGSLFSLPSNPVAYLAVLTALVSAAIHLALAPGVMGFNQTLGVLFVLNAGGFLGGIVVFLSRYWRRELYLVAAAYGLVTIVAFFAISGRLNAMSIGSKVAEGVFVLVVVYLYQSE